MTAMVVAFALLGILFMAALMVVSVICAAKCADDLSRMNAKIEKEVIIREQFMDLFREYRELISSRFIDVEEAVVELARRQEED